MTFFYPKTIVIRLFSFIKKHNENTIDQAFQALEHNETSVSASLR